MSNNSSISCSCGKCELVLNERRARFAFLCACEDCRQALSSEASKAHKLRTPIHRLSLFGE